MTNDEETKEIAIAGKTVLDAVQSKNGGGYDLLRVRFSDGTELVVLEEGQVGWFSVRVQHC
jgi:hypothetical protein